jgi:hypothetical protein
MEVCLYCCSGIIRFRLWTMCQQLSSPHIRHDTVCHIVREREREGEINNKARESNVTLIVPGALTLQYLYIYLHVDEGNLMVVCALLFRIIGIYIVFPSTHITPYYCMEDSPMLVRTSFRYAPQDTWPDLWLPKGLGLPLKPCRT